jgi:hypothetical protein
VSKLLVALFAFTAPLAAVQANPSAAEPQQPTGNSTEAAPARTTEARTPPSERRICRRIENTGSRTDAQRVCMTAAEWRRANQ